MPSRLLLDVLAVAASSLAVLVAFLDERGVPRGILWLAVLLLLISAGVEAHDLAHRVA